MRDNHDRFTAAKTRIVAVARHDSQKVADYFTKEKLPFPGVADPDARLGDLFGQERKILKLGLMPATLVIDRDRVVRYARYGNGMSDIPTADELLDVLGGLD
jgi:peroxiredoxin Q/BCP